MKHQRWIPWLMAGIMVSAVLPTTTLAATYQQVAPTVAISMSKTTNVDDQTELTQGQVFDVTVRFRSILAPQGEPFTITATNGAVVLINNPSDVVADMGGVSGNIRDISNAGGVTRFMTSTPATTPLENSITFQVQAPSADFSLATKIGLDNTPNSPANFSERHFQVNVPFTVHTSQPIVTGDESFDVFGKVGLENPGSYAIGFSISHSLTGTQVLADFAPANADGNYRFDGLIFPADAPEGSYTIEANLLDAAFNVVAVVQTTVEHQQSPPPTVSNVPDAIEIDEHLSGIMFVTGYPIPFRNIFRASTNSDITISGVATREGMPVANAEIIVGIEHFAWENWTASFHIRTTVVTTDADGRFSGVVRTAPGHMMGHPTTFQVWNGMFTHTLERSRIFVASTDPVSILYHRYIYLLARSS